MSKVLLVTDIFPPDIGGPATFIDALAHAVAKQGRQVTVVCHSEQPFDDSDTSRPFTVCRTFRNDPAVWDKTYIRLLHEMQGHTTILVNGLEYLSCRAAREAGCEYVLKIVGDYVWEAARNTGRTALSVDEFQSVQHTEPWFHEHINRRAQYLREAKFIIVPSQYLKRMVVGWGVEETKIFIITNGIPLEKFTKYLPQRRNSRLLKIAFCGRLVSWKGVDTLIEAVKDVQDVHVEVFGDGPERNSLEALSRLLQTDGRVRFNGVLLGDDLRRALSQCHVLVLGSQYEGLSHTLIEAGALGLARVASTCGGNPEIVCDGENGILVPYGEVEPLRNAIVKLKDDEDYRMYIAFNGKVSSYLFDFKRTVNETIQLLNQNDTVCSEVVKASGAVSPEGSTCLPDLGSVKVCHIIELGEYHGLAPFSGAENHLFVLMQALVRIGVNVEFIPLITSDGPALHAKFRELEQSGILVTPVSYEGTTELEQERNTIDKLKAILATRTDHIVHTHLEKADYVGRVAAWLANCRMTMSSVHNNEPFYAQPVWQRQLQILDNFNLRYIAISNAVREHLIQVAGVPPEKITTVYYGMKQPALKEKNTFEIRKAANIPTNKFVIGFMGRLQPQKNIELLIDAMERLPHVHCVIVGGGYLGPALEYQVIRKKLANVQFLGYQPNGPELISCFDLFCLPSLWEGLGLVLLEAMLQKVPVVASTAGAIPEVLQYGKAGLLFDPKSVDDLVAKLSLAIGNPALMKQYAEDAYAFATSLFVEERMVSETVAVYKSIIRETL